MIVEAPMNIILRAFLFYGPFHFPGNDSNPTVKFLDLIGEQTLRASIGIQVEESSIEKQSGESPNVPIGRSEIAWTVTFLAATKMPVLEYYQYTRGLHDDGKGNTPIARMTIELSS